MIAQSTDQQSRACFPAHLKFRLLALLWPMGFGFKLVVPLPPTKFTLCMMDVLSGTSHKYSDGVKLEVVKGFTRSGHSVVFVWSKCVCEHRRAEDRRQSR